MLRTAYPSVLWNRNEDTDDTDDTDNTDDSDVADETYDVDDDDVDVDGGADCLTSPCPNWSWSFRRLLCPLFDEGYPLPRWP